MDNAEAIHQLLVAKANDLDLPKDCPLRTEPVIQTIKIQR